MIVSASGARSTRSSGLPDVAFASVPWQLCMQAKSGVQELGSPNLSNEINKTFEVDLRRLHHFRFAFSNSLYSFGLNSPT